MTKIKQLADMMNDELESAREYAELYVEKKASGDSNTANVFNSMANEELTHASNIHNFIVNEINKLKEVYTPPVSMMEQWEKDHKQYVERHAWIAKMLEM